MYKIKFTKIELEKLNTIENKKIRYNTMSIYSYLKKLIQETGEDQLSISLRILLKRYIRFHQNISLQTLKNRIDTLTELNLLKITKINNKHVYKLDKFLDKKLDNKKVAKDLNNTNVEEDLKSHKDINNKNNNNNIYINTNANFGQLIQTKEEALVITKQVIKSLNIKSKWVINSTISTIQSCYNRINKLGAFKYISKVILKLQAISKSVYKNTNVYCNAIKNYRANNINNTKKLRFNNFTQRQRSEAEWHNLEQQLLGW